MARAYVILHGLLPCECAILNAEVEHFNSCTYSGLSEPLEQRGWGIVICPTLLILQLLRYPLLEGHRPSGGIKRNSDEDILA